MPVRIEDLNAAFYQVILSGLERRLARIRGEPVVVRERNRKVQRQGDADDGLSAAAPPVAIPQDDAEPASPS